jgi:hypothetical protein
VAVLSAGAVIALSNVGVASGGGTVAPHNVVLVYNGPAVPNTQPAPSTPAFTSWCDSECEPSVSMPAVDASTGRVEGTIYVWTKNLDLTPGAPLAFGEFVWFALNNGDIYVHSGETGTGGAIVDPLVRQPTHLNGDPGVVAAGGGDGDIVGGTGKYKKWTGTYTDRVFVELNFAGGPNYYDQLFWSINPN